MNVLVGMLDEAHMSKKMLKIKKMITLEMELSKKIEHKDEDWSKIQEQKELFEACRKQNKEVEDGLFFISWYFYLFSLFIWPINYSFYHAPDSNTSGDWDWSVLLNNQYHLDTEFMALVIGPSSFARLKRQM